MQRQSFQTCPRFLLSPRRFETQIFRTRSFAMELAPSSGFLSPGQRLNRRPTLRSISAVLGCVGFDFTPGQLSTTCIPYGGTIPPSLGVFNPKHPLLQKIFNTGFASTKVA